MTEAHSHPVGTVERTFQLAREGNCRDLEDLRTALKGEGCVRVDHHLSGKALNQQLANLVRASRT